MKTNTLLRAVRQRMESRDERGAYALLMAVVLVLVMALAAISVDIASHVDSKQRLRDTMDAAAQSAALAFDDANPSAAVAAAARQAAQRNGHDGPLNISNWCVVASTGADKLVNTRQITSTCDPGWGTPYTAANPKYAGLVCDETLCFIPCDITKGKCNTVRLEGSRDVDYNFAPAIGYDKGNTGSVVTVACKGSCGTESPNPLDIVIMADRTASMLSQDRTAMKSAILASLQTMNPAMHHVAFGSLHKSRTSGFTHKTEYVRPTAPAVPTYEDCQVAPKYGNWTTDWRGRRTWTSNAAGRACETRNNQAEATYEAAKKVWEDSEAAFPKNTGWDGTGDTNGDGYCKTEAVRVGTGSGRTAANTRSEGTWIPVPFKDDFLLEGGALNNSSELVDGVNCLYESASGEYGTHLAGALKGAARYLLNGARLPSASARPGTPRKVIIFETDGMPDEVGSAGGSTSLNDDQDVFAGQQSTATNNNPKNGNAGCNNFKQVAQRAKDAGILIITIGFGAANTAGCERYVDYTGEQKVRDVLAAAASPVAAGTPSTAGACVTDAEIAAENSDGDYFFCAAKGGELADIFRTALTQLSGGVKLLKMPSS